MPRSPKKECRETFCKERQLSNGYCEQHKDKAVGWFKTSTKSRHQRGYGNDWYRIRNAKIKMNPLCEYCKEDDVYTVATEVDHVVALANGGTHSMDNLKSSCKECHKIKTAQDRLQKATGDRGV